MKKKKSHLKILDSLTTYTIRHITLSSTRQNEMKLVVCKSKARFQILQIIGGIDGNDSWADLDTRLQRQQVQTLITTTTNT